MNKMISSVALLAIAGNLLMAGGDIAPVEPVAPEVIVSEEWNYFGTVYLWGSGIKMTTTGGTESEITFSDIIDNLDMALMGTLGAQKGKWGIVTDFIYMNISKGLDVPVVPGVLNITNIEMKSWVVTPMVTYTLMESEQMRLAVLGGARYLYLKSPIEFNNVVALGDSDKIWDGVVGVRGQYDLNDKWYVPFHLDIGTGNSDLTWQAFAGVGYKYKYFDMIAGYRYLDYDFDDNDPAAGALTDLTMSGPMIGAKFYF